MQMINRTAILSLVLFAVPVFAQDDKKADNTAVNKQQDVTAQKQSNSKTDTEMTKKIRSSVTDDKSLSTYAHNVKIVTQDGKVKPFDTRSRTNNCDALVPPVRPP